MAFDAGAAASWLISNSGPTSKHQCAKYVRMGIEHGGISTAGRPVAAQDYVNFLPKIGFNQIPEGSPQVGDLCVINHGKYGHICMWCGSQWISDFKQRRAVPYSGGVNGVWYYRYNGEINNAGVANSGSMYTSSGVMKYIPMEVDVVSSEPDDLMMQLTFEKRSIMKEILYYAGQEYMEDEKDSPRDSIRYDNQAWIEDFKSHSIEDEKNEYEFSTNYGIGDLVKQYYKIGKMGTQLADIGGSDFGDAGGLANVDGDELTVACKIIAYEEVGKDFDKPLTGNELTGVQLKGESFKTFGFGQVYNSAGTKLLQDIKPSFTDAELREDFKKMVSNVLAKINKLPYKLTKFQKGVLCHRHHHAPKCYQYIIGKMNALGRVFTPDEFREVALAYLHGCRNWHIYAHGWTNGINRETQYWAKTA